MLRLIVLSILGVLAALVSISWSAPFAPALSKTDLDPATFQDWVDGVEAKIDEKNGPAAIVWLHEQKAQGGINFRGVAFGAGTKPGPRHLRIGLIETSNMGTVVLAGTGRVSVLKQSAAYPGNLADESQWISAERVAGDRATTEASQENRVAVWVLPKATATRAIRITHIAEITEKSYAGRVNGIVVFTDRLANIAPQALPTASANEPRFGLLVNESSDSWSAWDNWDDKNPPLPVKDQPAWITLTWPTPVKLRGL